MPLEDEINKFGEDEEPPRDWSAQWYYEYQQIPSFEHLRKHKRWVNRHCTFCGRYRPKNMLRCSLCKAARYCDIACQSAHYVESHRSECTAFKHPPFTIYFLSEPIAGNDYAIDHVLARGHRDGIGCWVSICGTVDGRLTSLFYPMHPPTDEEMDSRHLELKRDIEREREWNILKSNLLTLQVLVQNRRKDKQPALIFGGNSQVSTLDLPAAVEGILKGSLGRSGVERIKAFRLKGDASERLAIGVAHDPWWDQPRLTINNFNGITNRAVLDTPQALPDSIHNEPRGVFALHPGEFAVFQAQYRIGDGAHICEEYPALISISDFSLPFLAPWHPHTHDNGASPVPHLDGTISGGLGRENASTGIHAPFDLHAVDAYYRGYRNGLYAARKLRHIESHHGREELERWLRHHIRRRKDDHEAEGQNGEQ